MMKRTTSLMQLALALCLMLAVASPSTAAASPALQSGPKVTAQLATGVVKLGSVVSCVLQVEGSKNATLEEVPEVDGLRLEQRSGPSVNESSSFINGRFSHSRTLTWVLTFRPDKVGDYVIPPMRLSADGKTLSTRELTLSVVKDLNGEELGYFEFVGTPEKVYEGQPFTVRMNFGWDTKLNSMVNVANLILPWWNELPGTLEVEGGVRGVKLGVTEVHVNSRVRVRATDVGEQSMRGKTFRVLQVTRSFVATRSGRLNFPQSWLEFGHVRRRAFTEQKETYHVGVPAFAIEVKVLPENGRPPEFSGGVGSFKVKANVNRRDVDLGESIKLTVDWTGSANLEFFDLPDPGRLDAFKDFRVYGSTNDTFYGDRRRVIYDLAPKHPDVGEVPGLPLVIFDPELEIYRTVSTLPIPIRVREIEGVMGLVEEGEGGQPLLTARDMQSPTDSEDDVMGVDQVPLLATWLGLPLLWFISRICVRRRGDPAAPAARRRRGARKRLSRDLRRAQGAGEQALAFHEFLGARTDEEATAWDGRDLNSWSSQHDQAWSTETLQRFTATRLRLDQSHWAGDDSKLDQELVMSLADDMLAEGL